MDRKSFFEEYSTIHVSNRIYLKAPSPDESRQINALKNGSVRQSRTTNYKQKFFHLQYLFINIKKKSPKSNKYRIPFNEQYSNIKMDF